MRYKYKLWFYQAGDWIFRHALSLGRGGTKLSPMKSDANGGVIMACWQLKTSCARMPFYTAESDISGKLIPIKGF